MSNDRLQKLQGNTPVNARFLDSEQQDMYRLLQESRAREARLSMELAESRQDSEILSRRQVARDRELVEAQKEIAHLRSQAEENGREVCRKLNESERLRAELESCHASYRSSVRTYQDVAGAYSRLLAIVSRVRATVDYWDGIDAAPGFADDIRAALEGDE